jgi:lactoylglutathione lyase
MIPVRDLFEAHLSVSDLQRSMSFFGDTLGLELAQVFPQKRWPFTGLGIEGLPCSVCGKQVQGHNG